MTKKLKILRQLLAKKEQERLQILEKPTIEHAVLLENETHKYRPTVSEISAIRYDGTIEMSIAIEENCPYTYCEWDEGENFSGLRGFTLDGKEIRESQYAIEGDYFIRHDKWYELMTKQDFESKYELTAL